MAEENSCPVETTSAPSEQSNQQLSRPTCQLCSGRLIEIRGKLQCERCHTIWETCCEGGRW
jgi:hypothetical protein